MTSKKQVRVSPQKTSWRRVHTQTAKKDIIHAQTKQEAVARAREIAKHQSAELIIQKKNWKIHQKNSYGRDPFPPRDR